ncbi:MAG: cyclic pyranopterin monophosphate synthase MoaC [Acidimicrobiales bacterium]
MSDPSLTHVDEHGRARMVDVTGKAVTLRRAVARCVVRASGTAIKALRDDDAVAFSRAAGMLAAARAPALVPLCHPLPLDEVVIRVDLGEHSIEVVAETTVVARTGVEIEALTACAITGLNLVMALLDDDPSALMDTLALWEKSGGRSGTWRRSGPQGDESPSGQS